MDEITRYEPDCTGLEGWQVPDFEPDPNGSWVAYEDHAAELARLRARVEELVRRGWVRIPYRMDQVEYSRSATSVDDLFAALDAAREWEGE